MRKLYLAAILALAALPTCALAQQAPVDCAPSTTCSPTSGPSNTGTGDPAWKAFGKVNANELQLFSAFGVSSNLYSHGSVTTADILNLWGASIPAGEVIGSSPSSSSGLGLQPFLSYLPSLQSGDCLTNNGSSLSWGACGGPGTIFQANGTPLLSSSTVNFVNAAVTCGLTLAFSNPTNGNVQLGFSGTLTAACGGTGATSLSAAGIATFAGTITSADCAQWNGTTGALSDSGAPCGGSGGSSAFAALTSGTNTTATMTVGSGATITYSGAGVVNASKIGGLAWPTPISSDCLTYNGSALAFGACGGGNGTVGSGAAGQLSYYASSGTSLAPLTLSAAFSITSATLYPSYAVNAQTGTSYSINCSTAASTLVTENNASASGWSLPAATGACGAGFGFDAENLGAGTLTITPSSSSINGGATLVIPQNRGCSITSDGSNYQVSACTALVSGGGSGTVTSVGITVPSWLSVSGVPILTSGTAAITAAGAQAANEFVATPNGSAGAVALRAIVSADLPASLSTVTSVNGSAVPASAGTLPGSTGAFTTTDCIEVASTSPLELEDTGSACGSGGGGGNVSTSGSPAQYQTTVMASGTLITGVSPGTAGQCFTSNGSSAYPSYQSCNIAPQVVTLTSGTTLTPNCTYSINKFTVSTGTSLTINNPGTCTPNDGQEMKVEVMSSSGGGVVYSFPTSTGGYVAPTSLPFPAAGTAASLMDEFKFEYSAGLAKWKLLAYGQGYPGL